MIKGTNIGKKNSSLTHILSVDYYTLCKAVSMFFATWDGLREIIINIVEL